MAAERVDRARQNMEAGGVRNDAADAAPNSARHSTWPLGLISHTVCPRQASTEDPHPIRLTESFVSSTYPLIAPSSKNVSKPPEQVAFSPVWSTSIGNTFALPRQNRFCNVAMKSKKCSSPAAVPAITKARDTPRAVTFCGGL